MCVGVCILHGLWGPEDNLRYSVLSFHLAGRGDQVQAVRLNFQALQPTEPFNSPQLSFLLESLLKCEPYYFFKILRGLEKEQGLPNTFVEWAVSSSVCLSGGNLPSEEQLTHIGIHLHGTKAFRLS